MLRGGHWVFTVGTTISKTKTLASLVIITGLTTNASTASHVVGGCVVATGSSQ